MSLFCESCQRWRPPSYFAHEYCYPCMRQERVSLLREHAELQRMLCEKLGVSADAVRATMRSRIKEADNA